MAPSSPSSYANAHARVRILYSQLLSAETLYNLREAADLGMLVTLLKDSAYGPTLERLETLEANPRRLVYQIRGRVVGAYLNAIHAAPLQTRSLLEHLFRHFELDNLKAILRGIMTGSAWEEVRYVLFPLGTATVLPGETMLEAGNVAAASEQLSQTTYYSTLSHALQRFTSEQSLFPLEVALDLDHWRKLWESVNKLPVEDRASALSIIGPLVDMTNLMWAVRYRVYHQLSEEEIINYTLPFGYHLRDDKIRAVAAGSDIANIVEELYPGLEDVSDLLQHPEWGLSRLEIRLQRTLAERCRGAFTSYPFQISLELAVLLLIEMEIQDLTAIIEAKAAKMRPEDYEPYLINAAEPASLTAG